MNSADIYCFLKDFAGPLATCGAASAAGYFTYRQWKTARDKLILDLFEKRIKAYSELLEILREVLREGGQAANKILISRFDVATDEMHFLFGKEVMTYLISLRQILTRMRSAEKTFEKELDSGNFDQSTVRDEVNQNFDRIADAFRELPVLIEPYVSIAHIRRRIQ